MAIITIPTVTLDDWTNAETTPKLRARLSHEMLALDNSSNKVVIAAGPEHFLEWNLTTSTRTDGSGRVIRTVTIPAIELYSTRDAIGFTGSYYIFEFYDSRGNLIGAYKGFTRVTVPASISGNTSIRWDQLYSLNHPQSPILVDRDTLNRDQILNLLGDVDGGAVLSVFGRTGIVSLLSADVSTALGYTPLSQLAADARYSLLGHAHSSSDITSALGYTPLSQAAGDARYSFLSHAHSASDITAGVLAMARGGLGVALVDPDADRVLFWDDSAGQFTFLTLGTNLSITGTTINATGGGTPGGSNTQLQINNGGVFGATSKLLADVSTGHMSLGNGPIDSSYGFAFPVAFNHIETVTATALNANSGVLGISSQFLYDSLSADVIDTSNIVGINSEIFSNFAFTPVTHNVGSLKAGFFAASSVTSAHANNVIGSHGNANSFAGNVIGMFAGVYGEAVMGPGTASISGRASGVFAKLETRASGVMDLGDALTVFPRLLGGTLTDGAGVRILTPASGATITQFVGLYIEPQTVGTSTYNILSKGTTTRNSFEGTVLVGPAKLTIGAVSSAPSVVAQTFFHNSTDHKLYYGKDDGSAWAEVMLAGVSGPISVTNGGTGNSSLSYVALTDGATITWTVAGLVNNASVTLGGNRTLAFSGATSGMTGTLIVKQDGTGTRTLTLPAGSKVIGGGSGAITLSTAANAIDILTWTYDGTNYFWTYGKNYS
jgi:hypothetical protein